MNFYNWLLKFDTVDLPIGDLASDVKHDINFPKDIKSMEQLTDYLRSVGAIKAAIETAEQAFIYYSLCEDKAVYLNNELVWRD